MLRKPAPFLIIAVSFLVALLLSLPLSAKEDKPKPKSWEISGIVAALQDERSGVGDYAVGELARYDKKALKSSATADQIQTLRKIFENKKADVAQRVNAANALAEMGYGAKVDVKGLVDILKDKETKDSVRGKATETLGNLGNEAKPYVNYLATILKDKQSGDNLRVGAAVALWNLGETAKPHNNRPPARIEKG